MQRPQLYNSVQQSYDAALYALFKYGETLPKVAVTVPAFSLDIDFGTIINEQIEKDALLLSAFGKAFAAIGLDLDHMLMFEKVNSWTR